MEKHKITVLLQIDKSTLISILMPIIDQMKAAGLEEKALELVSRLSTTPDITYEKIINIVKEYVDIEYKK